MCTALILSLTYLLPGAYKKLVLKPTMPVQDLKEALLLGIWRMGVHVCMCVCLSASKQVCALGLEIAFQKSENKVNYVVNSTMQDLSWVSHCILKSHKGVTYIVNSTVI